LIIFNNYTIEIYFKKLLMILTDYIRTELILFFKKDFILLLIIVEKVNK
jgi:hypothetical protein